MFLLKLVGRKELSSCNYNDIVEISWFACRSRVDFLSGIEGDVGRMESDYMKIRRY
jgi:hypothetical protein